MAAKRLDSISPRKKSSAPKPVEERKPVVEAPAAEAAVTPQASETPATPETKPADPVATEPVAEPKKEETTPAEAEVKPTEAVPAAGSSTPDASAPEADKPQDPDSFESLFPEPSVVMSGPPSWVWWLLLLIGAAGLGFLAFDLTRGKIDQWLAVTDEETQALASPSPTVTTEATPTPTAEATPTATASATPSKSTITLRVLNGTTKTGAAGTAKTTLEANGFTVRTTGNANNQSYATTTIYYQAGKDAEAALVKEGLGNSNAILEQSTLANPDMVLVVIGTK